MYDLQLRYDLLRFGIDTIYMRLTRYTNVVQQTIFYLIKYALTKIDLMKKKWGQTKKWLLNKLVF